MLEKLENNIIPHKVAVVYSIGSAVSSNLTFFLTLIKEFKRKSHESEKHVVNRGLISVSIFNLVPSSNKCEKTLFLRMGPNKKNLTKLSNLYPFTDMNRTFPWILSAKYLTAGTVYIYQDSKILAFL